MATKKLTANTITYTSGGHYQTFNNLNNAKTVDNKYAECHIHGKNATLNRPSILTFKNLKASLPTGAMVTEIKVELKHSKAEYNGKTPNILAPYIDIVNGANFLYNDQKSFQKKAQAPTTTPKKNTVTFKKKIKYNDINDSNFGVHISYPTNANNNEGYLRIYWVRVTLTYKTSEYTVKTTWLNGEYNGDDYEINIEISNKNFTSYQPTLTITAEAGMSLKDKQITGGGTFTVVNASTYTYTPDFHDYKGQCSVKLIFTSNVTYASGVETVNRIFRAYESLNGTGQPCTVTVKKTRPIDPTVDTETDPIPDLPVNDDTSEQGATYIQGVVNEPIDITIDVELGTNEKVWFSTPCVDATFGTYQWDTSQWSEVDMDEQLIPMLPDSNWWIPLTDVNSDNTERIKIDTIGKYPVKLYIGTNSTSAYASGVYMNISLEIIPSEDDLTTPSCSILTLSNEELNRLGDGYTYTVQSMLKENTSETYVRDWYKNFRIGVFNNPISSNIHNIEYIDSETGETVEIVHDDTDYNSLTIDDILNGADYWSQPPTNVNQFSNLECRFPYNKNYPLYIIIVGDYTEATNTATITYTEPVITETEYYTGRILNGNYPVPINDLVANNGSTAEITIPALNTADTLIFYDLDLDEDYGTNTDIAIRGLQVNTTFQQNTDNLVCYATLVNSKNESKTRSIVLDQLQLSETGNQISIGQIGDLWGYHTQDITNLEDWEIHLTLNNGLNNNTGNANYGDVNLTIYTETVEHQNIKCTIEGEDLSYYGAFITSRTIPEGLKTDTKYINVNGTDTNDPYLQNIREKTIELEFDIGDNCDLEGATQTLRELTRLLVNKRDPYNRPIPKTITFSDYPDVYWEYILEDTIEPEIELSSYKVKVKLVVPAGTSYDITPTTTSTTGYISGIASVRPVILIQPTSDTVSITEYHTEQHMNLVYTNEWIGQYVEIDCDNRTATLLESEEDTDGTDITPSVDWNSDWFTIQEEYQYNTTGCNIVSITYQERW